MRESVAAFVVLVFCVATFVGLAAFVTWLVQWVVEDTFNLHAPFWPIFLLYCLGALGKALGEKGAGVKNCNRPRTPESIPDLHGVARCSRR